MKMPVEPMEREVSVFRAGARFLVRPAVVTLNDGDTLRIYNDTTQEVTAYFPDNIVVARDGVPIPGGTSRLYAPPAERRLGRFAYAVFVRIDAAEVEAAEGESAPRIIIR